MPSLRLLFLSMLLASLAAGAEEPVVRFTLGDARPVNRLVMGLNTPVSLAGGPLRATGASTTPIFRRLFQIARPTIVRYPGGTMANFWDWQNNTILPDETIFRTSGLRPGPNAWFIKLRGFLQSPQARADASPETFARLAGEIGAKILWVPNIVTGYDGMAAAFASFPSRGLPLDFVELGNEVSQPFYTQRWPTVEDYRREMEPLIATVRKTSLAARIAYSGDENFGNFEGASSAYISRARNAKERAARQRSINWAETLVRADCPHDFIAHSYLGYEDRNVAEESGLFKKLTPAQTVDYLLAGPQNLDARMRAIHGDSPRKIWLSEYNIGFHIGAPNDYIDTMAAALFTTSWQLIGLTHGDYEMLLLHSLSGPFGFLQAESGGRVSASPAAQLFTQMRSLVEWAENVRPIVFASAPTLPGQGRWTGTDRPALQGVSFEHAHESRLVLLNLGERTCRIAWPAKLHVTHASTWSVEDVAKPVRVRLSEGDDTTPLTLPITARELSVEKDTLTLPAHSFTVIETGAGAP